MGHTLVSVPGLVFVRIPEDKGLELMIGEPEDVVLNTGCHVKEDCVGVDFELETPGPVPI